jgi:ABC-2 type transport system permease protein
MALGVAPATPLITRKDLWEQSPHKKQGAGGATLRNIAGRVSGKAEEVKEMLYLRAVYTIWYRDVLRFWRDKLRIVGAMAFPLLFLVIFGSGLSGAMGMLAPGVDFSRFIFPGIVGMTVLMTCLTSGLGIVWDREFGFFREVLVAPVSRSAIVLGKSLGGATISMLQGVLLLSFSPLMGVNLSPLLLLQLLLLMFILAWALGNLGILIAARMKSIEAFHVIIQMMIMPLIFLSGIFFPVGDLPPWLNALVKINPATYGVDSIRQLMLGAPGPGAPPLISLTLFVHTMSIYDNMVVVGCFGLLIMGLAIWAFSHQE